MIPLDRYTITETLHESAAVALYRAVRTRDALPVVIKALRAELPSPRAVERLRHEFEIARALDSPYVIKPYELETQLERLLLILEDFGGEPLSCWLGPPLELSRFFAIAIQLAAALADIHRQGIVHKDLKPANILIQPHTGQIKLAGFGIATPLTHIPIAPSSTSLIEGSLAYMAPEQTGRMNRGIDHRSDFYALGVTFYELLTGALPFQAADPLEWMHCHIARTPLSPRQLVPALPEPIAVIVLKLLSKQAEQRYQSAGGLHYDLERCRAQWKSSGRIDPFPLGERDISDLFVIPQRLYGREEQVAALLNAFTQVMASGQPAFVLVSGYAGIGKSSLIQELHQPIMGARGFFLAGKFDQYQRDIPYATIVPAFRDLIQQILTESDERIQGWQAVLQQALGSNGQLIVDMIPQLALIIGSQPPVIELPSTEAQQRFQRVFQRFVGVFAKQEHPLALFLDDLQWLDLASLQLITYVITHPETRYLLVLGAYRDNEVSPGHPLLRTLEAIRTRGVVTQEVVLRPLALAHLQRLVADTVHRPAKAAAPLARLVYDKTAGNPFFAIQFLTTLYQERLLAYDDRHTRWGWNLPAIRRQGFTDNVAELMVGKLKRLSVATQAMLTLAACMGNSVEIGTLTLISARPEAQIHADLRGAVSAGLLRRDDGYTFLHDRVQEAAYALLPEEQRAAQHLRIGRLLLSRMSVEQIAENVFEVVNQLNCGIDLITDPREKEALWRLNFLAGTRAKAAIAYASARNYLAQATALLPADTWNERYAETFALYLELSECESLVGNFQRADELSNFILDHARSNLDRAKVYQLRMRLYQSAGRYDDAVTAIFEAAQLFGVTFPESDQEIQAALEAEIREIHINLAGRRIADLADAPLVTDSNVAMIITLFTEALPIAFLTRPAYFPLLTAKVVNFSLRYGNKAESCVAYNAYAALLVAVFSDIPTALDFSEMVLRLNEKLDDRRLRGAILLVHAFMHNVWRRHIATSVPLMEQAFVACLEGGDLLYGGYAALTVVWAVLEKGDPLDEALRGSERYVAFARERHNDVIYETIRLEQQFVACLKGSTREPASFDDSAFNEVVSFARITEAAFGIGIIIYHTLKQIAAFTYGQYAEALEFATRAAPKLYAVMSMPIEATYHFYHALTLAALYMQVPAQQQREFAAALEKELQRLKLWADNCPENFLNRYALVSAEIARIEGRELDAEQLYEQAIRSAHENGFVQNEALAYELASKFYRARGFETIAETYLRAARACYARWGADGKLRQIDRHYPQLVETQPLAPPVTFAARAEQLDLLAVIKASQAISREILLPNLQETLMRLVLESAGAQRGWMLLADGESLAIHALAEIVGAETRVSVVPGLPVSSATLPMALLNYIRRTGEAVVLADAAAEGIYATDTYIMRQQPRSVLGLPIVRQAQIAGMLYLENNLIAGAFTSNTLTALELLASQAAISLENALLYANLQQENTERQRAEEQLQRRADEFAALYDTARDLATQQDFSTLMQAIVERALSMLHLPSGGISLYDPTRGDMEVVFAKEGVLPLGTRVPYGEGITGRVAQSRQPLIINDFPTWKPGSPWLAETGIKSLMSVPMLSGGELIGVLSVGEHKTGRKFTDADARLLSLFAAQAASAIRNTHLLDETRTRAEQLAISEERFSKAFHASPTPMVIARQRDGVIMAINDKLLKILGYTRDEVMGRTFGQIGALDEQQRQKIRSTLQGHSVRDLEITLRTKSYESRAFLASAEIIEMEGEKCVLSSCIDMTERKQAEALRAGQSQILEMIATSAPLQDVLVSLVRLIESQAGGMLCSILFLDDDRQHVRHGAASSLPEAYTKAIHGTPIGPQAGSCGTAMYRGEPVIVTDILQDPLWDDYRDLAAPYGLRACWSTPIISSQGGVLGSFAMYYREVRSPSLAETRLIDIATHIAGIAIERKRAEEELRKHREHLEEMVAERTAELAVAKDKAEEADRLKSAFLATMSHELRTPLNSIIGFTGILLQGLVGPLNDEQELQLGMVKISARHLLNLINEILDLSKIEAGQVELRLEPFDPRALIDKTVQTLAPLAEKKQLKLIADIAPDVGQVINDPRRVEQILINLVSNAIKFTEQGQVRIECQVLDGWLLTSVIDTGIGVKPEDMTKLFTSFRQLDSTLARQHEGTGLGLAICQKLAGLLGGEIRVESIWGVGSNFTFALPRG